MVGIIVLIAVLATYWEELTNIVSLSSEQVDSLIDGFHNLVKYTVPLGGLGFLLAENWDKVTETFQHTIDAVVSLYRFLKESLLSIVQQIIDAVQIMISIFTLDFLPELESFFGIGGRIDQTQRTEVKVDVELKDPGNNAKSIQSDRRDTSTSFKTGLNLASAGAA